MNEITLYIWKISLRKFHHAEASGCMKVSIRCHRLFNIERIKVTSQRNESRSEGLSFILVLKRMVVIFLPRQNIEELQCSPG